MNTATSDLYEARWVTTIGGVSQDLYEVRNVGPGDPYVGPEAEGAGKLNVARAVSALRDGAVVYSSASGSGATLGTGHRDLQGAWEAGVVAAGGSESQSFVLHAAPAAGPLTATFAFVPGHPSDTTSAIVVAKGAWSLKLPGRTRVGRGGDATVTFSLTAPSKAVPGSYTGEVVVTLSSGQTLHLPVLASVPLHDGNTAAGNAPGSQAQVVSAHDVYAKDDTTWPWVDGTPTTGAQADWIVYPVQLGSGLSQARFSVYDSDRGDETYDLYLYDSAYNLLSSTHPFLAAGVTDRNANMSRGASTKTAPQVLSVPSPAAGTYYLAVNRARIGGTTTGDFGSFVLSLDEIH